MSTPSAGQPRSASAAVYRRRRLVVLLGLIAVVTAIVLIIVRPGQSVPAPVPTASVAKPTVTVTPTPEPTPTVNLAEYEECNPKSLKVLPVVDSVDYQPGVLPQLSLTIENTSKTACTYNVGTSAQVFTITSGNDTYWVSTDCQAEKSDTVAILEPGVVYPSTPFAWARERSSPDTCADPRQQVPGGGASYYLTTQVGDVKSSSSSQFLLY